MAPTPLFPFGHGLSYTTFGYSNLRFSAAEIGRDDTLRVSVDVQNTGARAGAETVQLYVEDVIATVSMPVQQLRGFEKIHLLPGEKKTVIFELTPDLLALYNPQMERVVEAGEFKVMIGASCADNRLTYSFYVR
jgi:beta-glucosidase